MGWKKKAAVTTGVATGTAVGGLSLGPFLAGIGAMIGGPAAPITGAIGYGAGWILTGAFGGFFVKKVGDKMDDDDNEWVIKRREDIYEWEG